MINFLKNYGVYLLEFMVFGTIGFCLLMFFYRPNQRNNVGL